MTERKTLSKIDFRILDELQKNGRISYAELARRVGLTTSPCMERVKRLEKEGIIKGYTALLDPEYLQSNLIVFVQIRLARMSHDSFEEFKEAAVAIEEVQECFLISGNFDYLIKARVSNMDHYRKFLGDTLLSLPGVQESTTLVVMEQVKDTTNLKLRRN
jgi:Lrp/AsnC family leucine-responsive transcriptional regulator